jgi:predicted DNA-binding transcriptional regulator AlpA
MEFEAGEAAELLPWLSAAEILVEWPAGLEEFLSVFEAAVKHRRTSTGISRQFGQLLRAAAHLEQIGYPLPADSLRDYLLGHSAPGHLDPKVGLFQRHKHRSSLDLVPWITQSEAAGLLAVRQAAVSSLVARGLLVGKAHPLGPQGCLVEFVLRQSVESLQVELSRSLDVRTTAQRLGIGRHAVLELVHADLLPRAVHTARGWRIPRRSVDDWEALCARLPRIKGNISGWISIRKAARSVQSSGMALGPLLRSIQAGSLRACLLHRQKGLQGIALSQEDLATLQQAAR